MNTSGTWAGVGAMVAMVGAMVAIAAMVGVVVGIMVGGAVGSNHRREVSIYLEWEPIPGGKRVHIWSGSQSKEGREYIPRVAEAVGAADADVTRVSHWSLRHTTHPDVSGSASPNHRTQSAYPSKLRWSWSSRYRLSPLPASSNPASPQSGSTSAVLLTISYVY